MSTPVRKHSSRSNQFEIQTRSRAVFFSSPLHQNQSEGVDLSDSVWSGSHYGPGMFSMWVLRALDPTAFQFPLWADGTLLAIHASITSTLSFKHNTHRDTHALLSLSVRQCILHTHTTSTQFEYTPQTDIQRHTASSATTATYYYKSNT